MVRDVLRISIQGPQEALLLLTHGGRGVWLEIPLIYFTCLIKTFLREASVKTRLEFCKTWSSLTVIATGFQDFSLATEHLFFFFGRFMVKAEYMQDPVGN